MAFLLICLSHPNLLLILISRSMKSFTAKGYGHHSYNARYYYNIIIIIISINKMLWYQISELPNRKLKIGMFHFYLLWIIQNHNNLWYLFIFCFQYRKYIFFIFHSPWWWLQTHKYWSIMYLCSLKPVTVPFFFLRERLNYTLKTWLYILYSFTNVLCSFFQKYKIHLCSYVNKSINSQPSKSNSDFKSKKEYKLIYLQFNVSNQTNVF